MTRESDKISLFLWNTLTFSWRSRWGFCCRIRLNSDYSLVQSQGNHPTELWELSLISPDPKKLKLDTHAKVSEQWFSLCLTVQRFKHFHIELYQLYRSPNVTWSSVCASKNQVIFSKVQYQKNLQWASIDTVNEYFWGQKTIELEINIKIKFKKQLFVFWYEIKCRRICVNTNPKQIPQLHLESFFQVINPAILFPLP